MIEVAQIIERLLLQNDCVIVPELGGFIAQDCEACYVKEENIFLPPYRSVNFNPRLTMNDGLFINEYAQLNGLSYSDAVSAVSSKVSFIRQQIAKHGKFNISGVGSLKATPAGNYEFTPLVCGIDSPEHYALDSLFVPTIKESTKSVPVVEVNTKEEKTVTVNIRKNVIRYAAAVAAAVVLSFFCILPFSSNFRTELAEANVFESVWAFFTNASSGNSSEPIIHHSETKPVDAVKNSGSKSKTEGVKISAENTHSSAAISTAQGQNAENASKTTVQATPRPYTLILASAIPQEGAERMVENLKREGLKDARVINDRNMLRVVYGQYANAGEAAQALREGRTINHAFDQAWILAIE